jgi:hypothetical protein
MVNFCGLIEEFIGEGFDIIVFYTDWKFYRKPKVQHYTLALPASMGVHR